MSAAPTRRQLRWLAPVLVGGVVAAGVAVPRLAGATDAGDPLPARSAAQLLSDVSTAHVDGLSGTVVTTTRLGLPQLPTTSTGGSAVSLKTLLAGSTTARVWQSGTDRLRLAVDAPFAEYDVVRNGTSLWTYDSASTGVDHVALPAESGTAQPTPDQASLTPQQLADQVLAAVSPTTDVAVGRTSVVAGRRAYELVLDPKDPGTLVQTVRIAVDGQTRLPLRVQVYGTSQSLPAVEVGFTSVRFTSPDASVFSFTPPAGSTVTEKALPAKRAEGSTEPAAPGAGPAVVGTGWTTVVEQAGVTVPASAQGMLDQVARPVPGGRVVTSALVTLMLTDDGRLLAGAVPAARLEQLAAQPR